MAGFLRPLMLRPPPALGSKRPGDLLSLLREAGRTAGLARRDVLELFRVMTMSVGDLLDEWFESDVLKGMGIDGRCRRLGRPAHARHRLQPPPPRARRARGRERPVGPRARRHGRYLDGDRAQRRGIRSHDPDRRGGGIDRRERARDRRDPRRGSRSVHRSSSAPTRARRSSNWRERVTSRTTSCATWSASARAAGPSRSIASSPSLRATRASRPSRPSSC